MHLGADRNPFLRPQRAGATFTFTLCCVQGASVSWRGALRLSGVLGLVVATQETLLGHLALVAGRTCIPGFHGTVATGDIVPGSLAAPGHSTDSKMWHPFRLSAGGGLCVPRSFGQRHSACRTALGTQAGCHRGSPLHLAPTHWFHPKKAYKLVWRPNLCNAAQGTPSDRLALVDSELTLVVPQEYMYLDPFKRCFLKIWLPNSLK